ncbi:MAG: hypothetical protein NTW19_09070 [Planctomycetota bacterium]|nr:hypothetical protein [Planctomycetota bacterium]
MAASTVFVDDALAVYHDLLQRGAQPLSPPEDKSYGQRDFGLRDLDGHLIMFSSPIG